MKGNARHTCISKTHTRAAYPINITAVDPGFVRQSVLAVADGQAPLGLNWPARRCSPIASGRRASLVGFGALGAVAERCLGCVFIVSALERDPRCGDSPGSGGRWRATVWQCRIVAISAKRSGIGILCWAVPVLDEPAESCEFLDLSVALKPATEQQGIQPSCLSSSADGGQQRQVVGIRNPAANKDHVYAARRCVVPWLQLQTAKFSGRAHTPQPPGSGNRKWCLTDQDGEMGCLPKAYRVIRDDMRTKKVGTYSVATGSSDRLHREGQRHPALWETRLQHHQ